MHASYLIPIKTVPGLNAREHWRTRAARVKSERAATALIVKPFPVPCIVRLIRQSSATVDDVNLQGACKAVRDEVAKICGVDDKPGSGITWVYAQEKVKRGVWAVRVEMLAI